MSSKRRNSPLDRKHFAPLFAALGDETRLYLVTKLSDGSTHSIAQLTLGTELTRQGVTKHLRILERTGLIQSVRSGRETLFELAPTPLVELREYLTFVSEQWDPKLTRLKTFVGN